MLKALWRLEISQQSAQYSIYYGVALVSRIDKIIGLFCKRALKKTRYSAKETCNFIDPTDRSHPIRNTTSELMFENFRVFHSSSACSKTVATRNFSTVSMLLNLLWKTAYELIFENFRVFHSSSTCSKRCGIENILKSQLATNLATEDDQRAHF